MYKKYYDVYDYWYQVIPMCNICTRHYRWISNGETSTSYRIMENLTMNKFVEITEKGVIFHSVDTTYQNLNGMQCTIYY